MKTKIIAYLTPILATATDTYNGTYDTTDIQEGSIDLITGILIAIVAFGGLIGLALAWDIISKRAKKLMGGF